MNDTKSKIKFYSLDSEVLDILKSDNKKNIDSSKTIIASDGFNKALKNVIDKDIHFLANKTKKIIGEINRIIKVNNYNLNEIDDDIKNIDNIELSITSILREVTAEKINNKIHFFSTNKKEKKTKIKNIDEDINTLKKYQSEIIAIKNEYNKLSKRKEVIKDVSVEDKPKKEEEENPLERTINFYLNKQKEK